jgi:hypothetical protein
MRLRVVGGGLLLLATAILALLVLRDRYALTVDPERPRAGSHIRLRTEVPRDWSRGLYIRMERREGGRWRPTLDLAPAWEATGAAHAKPAEGEKATGLLKAFSARGAMTLRLPEDVRPGRYRLRQRLIRPGPRTRDVYVELDLSAP